MKQIKWLKSCYINRIGDVSLCLPRINVDLFRSLIMVLFQFISCYCDENNIINNDLNMISLSYY